MGNTSEKISSFIIKTYWPVILFQYLKILLLVVLVALVINIIISRSFLFLAKNNKCFRNKKFRLISTCLVIIAFPFLLFSKMMIIRPQVFINNFALKTKIFSKYQDFLSESAPLFLLDFLIYSFICIFILFFSLSFVPFLLSFKEKLRTSWLKKIFPLLLLILILIFFKNSYFFSSSLKKFQKPNIIFLSSDALRPDHFSGNGYFRETTPNIDHLLDESVQVRGMITTVPRTFPAWVSILTSEYPLRHKIRHMFPRTRERSVPLKAAPLYLTQEGYTTSVISDFAGDIFPRIDLGFETIKAPEVNSKILIRQIILEKQVFLLPFLANSPLKKLFPEIRGIVHFADSDLITTETIEEIKTAQEEGKPFFITSFYSITHFPFSAPYPYYQRYSDPNYQGPHKYFKQVLLNLDPNSQGDKPCKETKEDQKQVVALYDSCLRLFDDEVGKIINYLKKDNLFEDTIIVILSDHGENLYEHNHGMGHGEHLRSKAALEIPCIIKGKSLAPIKGKTCHQLVSSIDLMPTIFKMANLEIPGSFKGEPINFSDRTLMERLSKVEAYVETGIWFEQDEKSDLFFQKLRLPYPNITELGEVDFSFQDEVVIQQKYSNLIDGAKHRAIYSGPYKLIYLPLPDRVKFELYNHLEDSANLNDLSKSHKSILEEMKKRFYLFIEEEGQGNYIRKDDFLIPAFDNPIF